MSLPNSYLITTKNLDRFLNALLTAKAPKTFTLKFLESLEFKTTNDRLFIGILKSLGFLDANSAPTDRYYQFLDQSQSKFVLAEAIREAYGDLFSVNIKANELSVQETKNKLKTLTQGKNSENVLKLMANTFKALVDYAEWTPSPTRQPEKEAGDARPAGEESPALVSPTGESTDLISDKAKLNISQLHYNIQIILPESRDTAVYDALFKSLRKHLL